jgi:hypothetical protein
LLASVLIIVISALLFCYWFRCTCVLILEHRTRGDFALKVASTIRLSFFDVQRKLEADMEIPSLDNLHASLERDYEVLRGLLCQVEDVDSIENRILRFDYQAMQLWYKWTKNCKLPSQSRVALSEMSSILGYFAMEIGERASL